MNNPVAMIELKCPSCERRLRAPQAAAGKTAKCSQCNTKIRIPSPARAPSVADDRPRRKPTQEPLPQDQPLAAHQNQPSRSTKATRQKKPNPQARILQQIAAEFDGQVPRNPLNFAYQLTLILVAVVMVVMPLLYCCLIGSACYGMYRYWTDVLPNAMSTLPRGRAAVLAILVYAAPVVAGCIMIVFMIKPIFFSLILPKDTRQRSLKRASEPALFDLVDRICDVTRSPRPRRIDVNSDVNASASLRRGFLSLLGKDLVLTIGMPLVAGMNARQLAGILGHEFGHFSQGAGMKSTYLIRAVNMWFARVVYQRDQLDAMLDDAIANSDFRISLLLMFGKMFVIISRGILWCFMMLAHSISCLMSRQMEFDADRYEAFIAGSDYFEITSKRLIELAVAQNQTHQTVMAALNQQVLLDDLPGITADNAGQVTSQERKRFEQINEAHTRSFFSTHPSDESRIRAAKKYKAEGIFQLEIPARELFKNFDATSTGVSADFYRNQLGVMVDPSKLTRISDIQDDDR